MATLRVGQPYHPTRTHWPEAVTVHADGDAMELLFFMPGLHPAEVAAFREAPVELGLHESDGLLLILYRAVGIVSDWSDAPFSAHLEQQVGDPKPRPTDRRHLITLVLVGAEDGLVRALRAVSVSGAWWTAWAQAVRAQLAGAFEAGAFQADLARLYRRFPDAQDLLRHARVSEIGGAV